MGRLASVKLAQLLARRVATCQQHGVASCQTASRTFASMPQAVEDDAPVNSKDGKVLHPDLLNENMRKCQYAVRGELYLKAEELRQQGRDIILTNGNASHIVMDGFEIRYLTWLLYCSW